ncbi:hypothetical protein TSUD_356100 [Trifolium subterraneum]|uniref:RNase H type-1 domain-containing protein n=1 Tax=Trifolium subterraneum TaxID=3900 RepID=A0A2Z6MMG3_TRISU|nr:hypothetical protein TSUD_356100 [Trifolium subterraneum]
MGTSESFPHIFLHCNFAAALWQWLGELLHTVFDRADFLAIFRSCNPSWCSQVKELSLAAIIHTFHTIWMARNVIRFNNAKISLHAAKTKIQMLIAASTEMVKGVAVSSMETLEILHTLKVEVRYAPAPTVTLVLWTAPSIFWIKVNTDGSFTGNSAACGGIFRGHCANYIGSFTSKLSVGSVLHTELMAMVYALEEAAHRGWWNIWLESDSKIALEAFTNHDIVPWDLRNRWTNCLSLDVNVKYSHIYREGNACADKLANEGHVVTNYTWWDSMPACIKDEFLQDKLGFPSYRTS